MDGIITEKECSCCFSGHRNLTKDELERACRSIAELVPMLVKQGITRFYAGGAVGFDMAAAVAVLNLKHIYPELHLTLALPCRGHTAKWSKYDKELFSRVTERADSVVYVSDEYSRGCMQKRNKFMVDRSTLLIAWLSSERGGTYNTVAYAEKQGIKVMNLADGYYGEQIGFEL